MTLYTRGYRRYEDGFASRALRFGPIYVQGYRGAVQSKSFRRFALLFVLILVIHCMTYYLNPLAFFRRMSGGEGGGPTQAETLRQTVASFLGALDWLSPILVLFIGSGLVADDLKSRALPLYLVRPITPTDYWFGKWLIPAGVLLVQFLLPTLFLVLFGILLEPSDHVLDFAAEQGRLVLGVLASYVAASAAYGSLVLVFSTLTGRRTPALVVGAACIFIAPVLVTLAISASNAGRMDGAVPSNGMLDAVRTLVLPNDVSAIFHAVAGHAVDPHAQWFLPPVGAAVAMVVAIFLLGAFVMIRRARTVEVVS